MTPEQAIAEAKSGTLRPVYLLLGEERFHRQRVLAALRLAVLGTLEVSFNEDQYEAGDSEVDRVTAAARTLPMLGPRRLVLLKRLERWEAKGEDTGKGSAAKAFERLVEYAQKPSPTTTLILVAEKLDSKRTLFTLARKEGFLVTCNSPPANELPGWVSQRAQERGQRIAPAAAELMADLVGADLSALEDAIERVSLFVGKGAELSEAAVLECVANMKPGSVWDLVGAVGRRDARAALLALGRVFEPGEGPRLVGLLCWSMRQFIRFASARRAGMSPADAAKQAGIPPFKEREMSNQLRQMPLERAEQWLVQLSEVDLALKGGSRLPARTVLEQALLGFCTRERN
jgi:DNA polymerase III subunit delta